MPNLSELKAAVEVLNAVIEEQSGLENVLPTMFDNNRRRSIRAVMDATGATECEVSNFVCNSDDFRLHQGRQKLFVEQA